MSVEVAGFEMRKGALTRFIPDVCGCHVLRILVVAVCRIGDVCCLPAPAHQPISFNSFDLSALEEVCRRNARASGTLKFGYEGFLRLKPLGRYYCWWLVPEGNINLVISVFGSGVGTLVVVPVRKYW